ncbi:MAG: hypothetical protein JXA14_03615 [Anaerolineae bacterium]|nr:hypothetical protein [Anaerolineae bacterium]
MITASNLALMLAVSAAGAVVASPLSLVLAWAYGVIVLDRSWGVYET